MWPEFDITAIRSLSLLSANCESALAWCPPFPKILWPKRKIWWEKEVHSLVYTYCTCSRTFCILHCLILFTGYAAAVQVTCQEVKLSTLKSSLLSLSDHLCLCACRQTKIPKESRPLYGLPIFHSISALFAVSFLKA